MSDFAPGIQFIDLPADLDQELLMFCSPGEVQQSIEGRAKIARYMWRAQFEQAASTLSYVELELRLRVVLMMSVLSDHR
jgi:hypothetical protein